MPPANELDRERVISAMHDASGDFGYLSFKGVAARSSVAIETVRSIVRALAAQGFAVFGRGLVTEDGEFYGSGYALTEAGAKAAREIAERRPDATPFGADVPMRDGA